jgi:hypothetical protein
VKSCSLSRIVSPPRGLTPDRPLLPRS